MAGYRLGNRLKVRLVRHPPCLTSTVRPSRNPMYIELAVLKTVVAVNDQEKL